MQTRGAGSPRRAAPGPLAAGAALLAVLLVLAGCTPAPEARVLEAPAGSAVTEPSAPSAPTPAPAATAGRTTSAGPDRAVEAGPVAEADAVALAAALTAALEEGEVAAWAGHFAPGRLRAQQRDWFAAVQATPMTVRAMHPLLLTPARSGRDAELTIGFRHQVTGADLVPTVERYRYLLARAGSGELLVTEVDGGGRLEVDHPQLWDLVPTAVTETEHLVLLHPRDRAEAVAEAMPRLDRAAAQVLADFPVPGVERLIVTAAAGDQVDQVFGGDVEQVLGFATGVPASPVVEQHDGMDVLPSERQIVARAVVDLDQLSWEVWDAAGTLPDPEGGSPLLRHEGVHALMFLREPGVRPARWVSEGLAGWYEERGDARSRELAAEWRASLLAAHGAPEGLPPADQEGFHNQDQHLHYTLAASVFEYLEHRYGPETAREVGVALHGVPETEGPISRVLQERLDTDLAGLEAGWLDWLAAQP